MDESTDSAASREERTPGSAENVGIPSPSESESVGTIREILFGQQMRSYEQRFSELEAHLRQTADSVLRELTERLDRLEHAVRAELDRLRSEAESADSQQAEALARATHNLQQLIDDSTRQLQHHKVDRSSLAALLTELAGRLSAGPDE